MTWYNNDWDYRKQVTIKGLKISGTHTNFPVLYKISGIGRDSLSNGTDIVFVDDDDSTRLHHDLISFYNYTGNAWVQVPTLNDRYTVPSGATFYMYYGNTGGGDQTAVAGYKPSSTWDNTYIMVCHMNDTVNSTTLTDSTKYQVPLYKSGAQDSPNMVSCFLGSCQRFGSACGGNYTKSFISSNINWTNYNLTGQASLSVIISGTGTINTRSFMVAFHDRPTSSKLLGLSISQHGLNIGDSVSNRLIYNISTNKTERSAERVQPYWPSTNIRKTSTVGLSFASGETVGARIYAEGTNLYESSEYAGNLLRGTGIIIGNHPVISNLYRWSGCILEVQVSNKARTYGWFRTFNQNISSLSAIKNTVFYTIGVTENAPAAGSTTTSFNTISGSAIRWGWGKADYDTTSAPRSKTANALSWDWGTVTGDTATYIPSGSSIWWGWCLENK